MSKRSRRMREEAVLVCKPCMHEQGRDADVDGVPLDEWLRLQLQALPGPALPLSRCKCLDLCPRHGVVVALGGRLAGSKPLHVVKNDDPPERVLRWLATRQT